MDTTHQDTKHPCQANAKIKIDLQWLPDINGWKTKMDASATHADKMWYGGLYERAKGMYEAELLNAKYPGEVKCTYPMTYWKKGDKQSLTHYCWENWSYANGAIDPDGEPECSIWSYPGCPQCIAENAHLEIELEYKIQHYHATRSETNEEHHA